MQAKIGTHSTFLTLSLIFGMAIMLIVFPAFLSDVTPAFAENQPQQSSALKQGNNDKRTEEEPESGMPEEYNILKVASSKINLNVEDGNVSDILKAIRVAAEDANIRIAYTATSADLEALTTRVTIKAKGIRIGDAFRLVAVIARTGFYILPNKFVIGPLVLLTEAERKSIITQEYDLPDLPKKTSAKNAEQKQGDQ